MPALAEDLDPGLLEMLASTGSLSEKQVGLVETIIGKKIQAAPAAEAATEPAAESAPDAPSKSE